MADWSGGEVRPLLRAQLLANIRLAARSCFRFMNAYRQVCPLLDNDSCVEYDFIGIASISSLEVPVPITEGIINTLQKKQLNSYDEENNKFSLANFFVMNNQQRCEYYYLRAVRRLKAEQRHYTRYSMELFYLELLSRLWDNCIHIVVDCLTKKFARENLLFSSSYEFNCFFFKSFYNTFCYRNRNIYRKSEATWSIHACSHQLNLFQENLPIICITTSARP